jgi:hypothetical protein
MLTPYVSGGLRCVVLSVSLTLRCAGIMIGIAGLLHSNWEPPLFFVAVQQISTKLSPRYKGPTVRHS